MNETIELTVNGKRETVSVDPQTPLLYVLRNDLGVLGPRFGCGLGQCGACTVHLDGTAIRSCRMPVADVKGAKVTTIEGLSPHDGALTIVQQAFVDEQAAQCGYCLSGWVMTATQLLRDNPKPTDDEIRRGLKGLKCRCGTHMSILRAVKLAASRMQRGWPPTGTGSNT